MNLNHLRVSAKLWITTLGLMILILGVAVLTQVRISSGMISAMAEVEHLGQRVTTVVRWRGMIETALTYVIGRATTTDDALAQRYGEQFKNLSGRIGEIQSQVLGSATSEADKQALQTIAGLRAAAVANAEKASEIKATGDMAAVQSFVDKELMPSIATYLSGLDTFVETQEKARVAAQEAAVVSRRSNSLIGLASAALVLLVGIGLTAWLVRSITRPLDQAVGLADTIAKGDLTSDIRTERKDEFGRLLHALSSMTVRLREVVSEVRTGVDSVSTASSQIAAGNADLSARTEQTAANLEETAASMEELTSTVTQSADTAQQANQLAAAAAQAAERGGSVVGEVVHSMQQITDSSRKINDIIGTIDGIAFQTNILALNAAVEAARAGEQGRGFAVVAGEVRSLAQRSAEAAKEIKALITASVQNVESGSQQVAQAGQSMEEIVTSVKRVSDLIGEITAAATEQREGISQVNQAVATLDQMTQQNAALVEESSAAATAMRDQAGRLASAVSVFNVGTAAIASHAAAPRAVPAATRAAQTTAKAPPRAIKSAAPPEPARLTAPRKGPATSEAGWETF